MKKTWDSWGDVAITRSPSLNTVWAQYSIACVRAHNPTSSPPITPHELRTRQRHRDSSLPSSHTPHRRFFISLGCVRLEAAGGDIGFRIRPRTAPSGEPLRASRLRSTISDRSDRAMDGEWSDGAAVSSPTVSGGDGKVIGRPHGVPAAEDSPGSSPVSPAAPSTAAPAATGRRRSANKRVVTVPLADVSGPRPKGVGEGNTPTDSWAWRKYGQKPIKGSPFPRYARARHNQPSAHPFLVLLRAFIDQVLEHEARSDRSIDLGSGGCRAYYRCSSNKGCPARKQVERNRAEPDMVIVTYSFEHNHSDAVPRAQQQQQNRQASKPNSKPKPSPPEPAESPSSGSHDVAAGVLGTEGGAAAAATAAVEVHDDFRWLYDGVSVTSSTSPSDVDAAADEMLYGATMFFGGAVAGAPLSDEFGDVGGLFDGGEGGGEEDAMFAGLGELPECAMVFRRHAGDGKVGQQPAESAAMS
ncbi:hypothetical protein HU200_037224 [Digitaria exilis]|uniref:WRKY domain-containing protein n=1 Tax=Digitaria exilis TaxID=1010633 RepID=A0A835BFN7_9POAL|nr:hypothetical protein HU200_037224 [Digitaria exilis]